MTGKDWPWEREKSRLVSSESEGNRVCVWGGQILLPCSKNIPNKLKFKIIKTNFRGQKQGRSEEFVKAEREKISWGVPQKNICGGRGGGKVFLERERPQKSPQQPSGGLNSRVETPPPQNEILFAARAKPKYAPLGKKFLPWGKEGGGEGWKEEIAGDPRSLFGEGWRSLREADPQPFQGRRTR